MDLTFDVGVFRVQFPEFADIAVYPTPMIEFWSELASHQVNRSIWCNAWLQGVSLYTAHEITLAAQNARAAQLKGTPGTFGGIANTKTVGAATIGFDSNTNTEKDAGHWNLTNYGKQFIRLARLFGTKAIQIPNRAAVLPAVNRRGWWP